MANKKRLDGLREESGSVTYSDPLTSFLYLLMRDEIPCGVVERLVHEVASDAGQDIIFTNGYLAKYAHNLSELIKGAVNVKLKTALESAFTVEESVVQDVSEIEDDTLQVKSFESNDVADHMKLSTVDDAKEIIKNLNKNGGLSDEDANRISNELEEVREEVEERQREEAEAEKKEIEKIYGDDIEVVVDLDEEIKDNPMDDIDKMLDELLED
jgi:hypothetical protein